MLCPLLVLALSPAFADEGYDAHGFNMATGAGGTRDGFGLYNATAHDPGGYAARGLIELADEPFVMMSQDLVTGERSSEELLGGLVGVNAGGYYAVTERLAVSATMPVWLRSNGAAGPQGAALGDLRVTAPTNLLLRDPTRLDVGVALLPTLTLPTGANLRYLGNSGPAVGGLAAVSVGDARWNLSANAGLDWRGLVGEDMAAYGLHGGLFAVGAVGGGVDLMPEKLGLIGELRGAAALGDHLRTGQEAPLEASLGLRSRSESGLGVEAGFSKGLSHGAGAAEWRAFAGVGYSGSRERDDEPLRPLVVAAADAALLVTVVDPDGAPIPGARVDLAGAQQIADMAGRVKYDALRPGADLSLDVAAQTWIPAHESVAVAAGENQRVVVLDPEDGSLKIIALDDKGRPIDARVRFLSGPEDQAVAQLGEDGERSFSLAAGDWTVLVATDTNVPEERSVTLPQAGHESIYVQFSGEKRLAVCSEKVVLRNVNFDHDVDVPRPEAGPVLESLARTLRDCPEVVLEVGGHTDWDGTDAYNVDLSQRRMNNVKATLVAYGVPADQLVAVGYGESQPTQSNTTAWGKAQNRRVEFTPIHEEGSVDATP